MSSFVAFPPLMTSTGQIDPEVHHLYYLGLLVVSFILMAPIMRLSDKPGKAVPIALAMILAFVAANVMLAVDHHFYGVMIGMALFFMAFIGGSTAGDIVSNCSRGVSRIGDGRVRQCAVCWSVRRRRNWRLYCWRMGYDLRTLGECSDMPNLVDRYYGS